MRSAVQARDEGVASFRTRLFTAIMVIVATLTAFGFYIAQRKVTADAERNLQENFQAELSSLHKLEELRHAALAERCDVLAAKPRIHAAMEDNAIDLLYPSAKDELRDLMEGDEPPPELEEKNAEVGMRSGVWANGQLYLPSLPKSAQASLNEKIASAVANSDREQDNFRVNVDGAPQLLFYKRLNSGSLFPAAYEICVYPLAHSMAQLHRLRWQIGGAGALLLLGGFVASHAVALRFSAPVKKLALDSEQNRAQRKRAEAALASTTQELERSARYSADASHQLKSPVTVLRICLETVLTPDGVKPEVYEKISALLHQTHRLTGVIDELLLLSRMDAGHLQIASTPVNLSQLVDEWLDDLSALPDSPDVKIEKEFTAGLFVAGEERYTSLIVQNLVG